MKINGFYNTIALNRARNTKPAIMMQLNKIHLAKFVKGNLNLFYK